jgi:hypothetical protein
MRLLIDGDLIVYRAGFSAQHVQWYVHEKGQVPFIKEFKYKKEATNWVEFWGDSNTFDITSGITYTSVSIALLSTEKILNFIFKALGEKVDYMIYFSSPSNRKDNIATILPYKGNRKKNTRPIFYNSIKKYIQYSWNWEEKEGFEADDLLSINQYQNNNSIIVTQDKDLSMVPGLHFNPITNNTFSISPIEGCVNFYTQLLTGDPTDNIPGGYRVTKKQVKSSYLKKMKQIQTEQEMYEDALNYYDGNIEVIKEIGNLLWMPRNYDDVWMPGGVHYEI